VGAHVAWHLTRLASQSVNGAEHDWGSTSAYWTCEWLDLDRDDEHAVRTL